jgi:hypothetical protein
MLGMKVFISWSGDTSRQVAEALRDWLPDVIQQLEPFLSSKDIASGSKWQDEISSKLDETTFGVICLTKDNLDSPWVNFEAGALSKYVEESLVRVVPLLHGLKKTDVRYPLAMFQAVTITKDGLLELLRSLNASAGEPLTDDRLIRQVHRSWTDFEQKIKAIPAPKVEQRQPERTAEDMLSEILTAIREERATRPFSGVSLSGSGTLSGTRSLDESEPTKELRAASREIVQLLTDAEIIFEKVTTGPRTGIRVTLATNIEELPEELRNEVIRAATKRGQPITVTDSTSLMNVRPYRPDQGL